MRTSLLLVIALSSLSTSALGATATPAAKARVTRAASAASKRATEIGLPPSVSTTIKAMGRWASKNVKLVTFDSANPPPLPPRGQRRPVSKAKGATFQIQVAPRTFGGKGTLVKGITTEQSHDASYELTVENHAAHVGWRYFQRASEDGLVGSKRVPEGSWLVFRGTRGGKDINYAILPSGGVIAARGAAERRDLHELAGNSSVTYARRSLGVE